MVVECNHIRVGEHSFIHAGNTGYKEEKVEYTSKQIGNRLIYYC